MSLHHSPAGSPAPHRTARNIPQGAEDPAATVISARDLGYRLPSGEWIFSGLHLDLPRGTTLAVLGPNGRGKTTLLRVVLGLLKPSAGRVTIAGSMAYVPQSSSMPFAYTVRDVVVMGRARHLGVFRSPGAADYGHADRALARLGLSHLSSRSVTTLSGGQRQLVMIARAIAADADILILDEPTAALDFNNQDRVLAALADLAGETGVTVVFTTHHPQHALAVAPHALAMFARDDDGARQGASARFGPTGHIVTAGAMSELYSMPIRTVGIDHGGRAHLGVVPLFGAGPEAHPGRNGDRDPDQAACMSRI